MSFATPGNNTDIKSPHGVWSAFGTRRGGEVIREF